MTDQMKFHCTECDSCDENEDTIPMYSVGYKDAVHYASIILTIFILYILLL